MVRKRAWLLSAILASPGSLVIGACGGNDATGPGNDGGVSEGAADQTSGDGSNNGGGEDGSFADGHEGGGSGGDGALPDTGQPLCNDPCVTCLQQTCTSQVNDCLADASCRAAWESYQACRCADAGSCDSTFNQSGASAKVVVGCGLTTNCQASCQF